MRDELHALRSLAGPFQGFDPDAAPDEPEELFADWLRQAIAQGIKEPHAMMLSTVDERGEPDARLLILKNLDRRGWHFATSNSGPKGRQLAGNPAVALTLYWPELGRQVRIRGRAVETGGCERDTDFRLRSVGARAAALLARQSDVLGSGAELEAGLQEQQARLLADPEIVASNWAVFVVGAREVEFFQGERDRRHQRLRYRRDAEGWIRERLWP